MHMCGSILQYNCNEWCKAFTNVLFGIPPFTIVGSPQLTTLKVVGLLKYMIICEFENSPSIPSFFVTKIVYIGYGQLKKLLLFLLPFHSCAPCRAHQARRSGRNSRPISAEVALPGLQSEIKVVWIFFAKLLITFCK